MDLRSLKRWSKCRRQRIQTAFAFLCTRVVQPDVDDWKKLGRCIRYILGTKGLGLTLQASDKGGVKWYVDASFAVHHDMKSHTGIAMTLGKDCPICVSTCQQIHTKSSTEAELMGVDDGMPAVIWTRIFFADLGYAINDNVVYQDNQSTILLERNEEH